MDRARLEKLPARDASPHGRARVWILEIRLGLRKVQKEKDKESEFRGARHTHMYHTMDYEDFVPTNLRGNVTKFALHTAQMLIAFEQVDC